VVVLRLVISAAEFADALEHGSPILPKIGEGKGSLRPVIERLEHIDASCNDTGLHSFSFLETTKPCIVIL